MTIDVISIALTCRICSQDEDVWASGSIVNSLDYTKAFFKECIKYIVFAAYLLLMAFIGLLWSCGLCRGRARRDFNNVAPVRRGFKKQE